MGAVVHEFEEEGGEWIQEGQVTTGAAKDKVSPTHTLDREEILTVIDYPALDFGTTDRP
jgi:hypothetical protein